MSNLGSAVKHKEAKASLLMIGKLLTLFRENYFIILWQINKKISVTIKKEYFKSFKYFIQKTVSKPNHESDTGIFCPIKVFVNPNQCGFSLIFKNTMHTLHEQFLN